MNYINSSSSVWYCNNFLLSPAHQDFLTTNVVQKPHMVKQASVMTVLTVCLHLAAQLCRWTVMNVVVIYFIPQPLAGCERFLIPVRPSFSRPLIAQSGGHLIRSMKWGSRLLGQRFNISRKIRSILINYPSHWIVHICLEWRRGCFACGRTSCLIHVLEDGDEWHRKRWVVWLGSGGGTPSSK